MLHASSPCNHLPCEVPLYREAKQLRHKKEGPLGFKPRLFWLRGPGSSRCFPKLCHVHPCLCSSLSQGSSSFGKHIEFFFAHFLCFRYTLILSAHFFLKIITYRHGQTVTHDFWNPGSELLPASAPLRILLQPHRDRSLRAPRPAASVGGKPQPERPAGSTCPAVRFGDVAAAGSQLLFTSAWLPRSPQSTGPTEPRGPSRRFLRSSEQDLKGKGDPFRKVSPCTGPGPGVGGRLNVKTG